MTEDNYWSRQLTRRTSRRRLLGGGAAFGLGVFAAACGGKLTKPAASVPSAANAPGAAATVAAKPAGTTATVAAAQAANSPQANAGQPKKGGTLRWGIEADVATMDPVWTTVFPTHYLAAQLYDSLLVYDANLKPQPVLLKGWSVSPDKRTYTFDLRDDATFDGGRPILAADAVASIQRWGKKVATGVSLFAGLNSLQAQGDHAFVLETKEPYGLLIDSLTVGGGGPFIMTKEAAVISPDQRVDDVTASGPFKLAEWTKGSKIVLKPRTDYKSHTGPISNLAGTRTVYLDALEIPIIPDDSSRLAALQAGTIDVMTTPPTDYYGQLKNDPRVVIERKDYGYAAMLLNNTRPPFNNVLARQAVQAATDVDKLMTAGYGKDLWQPCAALFICGSPNESTAGVDQYNQKNLAKAKQLFQQLVQADGYDGRPVVLLTSSSAPEPFAMSQVAKQMLESIGFKVDLQAPDLTTAVTLRASKDKWDIYFLNGGPNHLGNNDPLRLTPLSPTFFGWYNSPQMQELQRQYSVATTPEQQKAAIDKVQALWYQDVPDVLLGMATAYDACRTYVKGFTNVPLPYLNFWNVWLDK